MKKVVLFFCTIFLSIGVVNGQSILQKFGEKAKNAIVNKVEQGINDLLTGNNENNSTTGKTQERDMSNNKISHVDDVDKHANASLETIGREENDELHPLPWLVSGGSWATEPSGPWPCVGPLFTFNSDMTFKYEEDVDVREEEWSRKGKYEIIEDDKLLLHFESGESIQLEINVPLQRIKYKDEWLFALNGTLYDEIQRKNFTPTPCEEPIYAHEGHTGVYMSVDSNENGDITKINIYQYPMDNSDGLSHYEIWKRTPVNTKSFTVRSQSLLFDGQIFTGLHGRNLWPLDGVVLEFNSKNETWYTGEYYMIQ